MGGGGDLTVSQSYANAQSGPPAHNTVNTHIHGASRGGRKKSPQSPLPFTINVGEQLYHINGGTTKPYLHPHGVCGRRGSFRGWRCSGGAKQLLLFVYATQQHTSEWWGPSLARGRPAPCLISEGCCCLNNPPCVLPYAICLCRNASPARAPRQLSERIMGGSALSLPPAPRPFVFPQPFNILTSHSELIAYAWCAPGSLCLRAVLLLLLLSLLYFDFFPPFCGGPALNCKCKGQCFIFEQQMKARPTCCTRTLLKGRLKTLNCLEIHFQLSNCNIYPSPPFCVINFISRYVEGRLR